MNSKAKGARGERMLAALLTAAGFPARRGQQFHGGSESPDIICPALARWHWEAKFTEHCRLDDWLKQVEADSNGKPSIIAWKRSHNPWLAVVKLDTLIDLIREALPPSTPLAPPSASCDAGSTTEPTPKKQRQETKHSNMKLDELYPSRWLKASDVDKPILATIQKVAVEEVGDDEQKPVITFIGNIKPMVLNRTNSATIAALYGDDTDLWIGKPVVLFSTKVQFQSKLVDAIRVREPRPVATPAAVKSQPPSVPAPVPAASRDDDVPF